MNVKQQKTSYYLYIDESGDVGDYLDKNNQIIKGSSKFFTLAGIIVSKDEKRKMECETNKMIDEYFNKGLLDKNFKLHYHPLRMKLSPYDQLSDEMRKHLADNVFHIIKKSDCALLSVSINLERHCKKYYIPANPQAYAMLIMLERFQDFLEEHDGEGRAIYERFNKKTRKKVERTMTGLREVLRLRHYKAPNNIRGHVVNGDPKIHPILQLTDFFAYATWIKITNPQKTFRWKSIKHKYFQLNAGWYRAGNVEI